MRHDKRAAAKGINHIEPFTVQHGLALEDRKVVMTFNRQVPNLWMSPAEAVEIAKQLLGGAQLLEPGIVKGFDWPDKKEVTEAIGTSVRTS